MSEAQEAESSEIAAAESAGEAVVEGSELEASEPDAAPVAAGSLSRAAEPLKIEGLRLVGGGRGHGHQLGTWQGRLDPKPSEWESGNDGLRFALTMPDGEEHVLAFDKAEAFGPSRSIFGGEVEGSEFSEVIVTRVNDAASGVIRLPAEGVAWELRNRGDGELEFEKVDLAELKRCGQCQVVH